MDALGAWGNAGPFVSIFGAALAGAVIGFAASAPVRRWLARYTWFPWWHRPGPP